MATLIQTLQGVLNEKDPLLSPETKRIILKEVLQAHVLDYVYNHPAYRRLNFYGGTCLHVVYSLNRLSEALDFDNQDGVDLSALARDLAQHFHASFDFGGAATKTQRGASGILRVAVKFPVLSALNLSSHPNEALHLKIEVSPQAQVAIIQHTPVLVYGRSLVAAHFSLDTMMAGKMLACLERNFEGGRSGAQIKGRDFYDVLWFMQQRVQPLEEKLARDGQRPYTVSSAMMALRDKIVRISARDLAVDLLPMFESRPYIDAWLDAFHDNFNTLVQPYLQP